MKYFEKTPAVLLLEDGTTFYGKSAGKIGSATGEICFNTGMTGYQEIFTDPSYFGQIMVTTNAHIGNYGMRYEEDESHGVMIRGLVVKNFTNLYSRSLADTSIQEYLLENNLIAMSDVDTRALVMHIRSKGAMNAIISSDGRKVDELMEELRKVPSMAGLELSSQVSTQKAYFVGDKSAKYKVAVLDLGVKKNILRHLAKRDCYLKIFPAKTSYNEMEEWKPNGYFISNGPGDPASTDYGVDTVTEILKNERPFFGICLGHQLFALALGVPTFKMHHGHRGLNHPVKNTISGRSEITSQNHGFGVDPDALENHPDLEITHRNLNDQTVEGIRHRRKKAFSVQFHPETAPGPHDSEYLFDNFIDIMKN